MTTAAKAPGRTSWPRLALLVARRDYVRTVKRRGFIFGTLLLPFGVAVLMAISGFFSSSVGGAHSDRLLHLPFDLHRKCDLSPPGDGIG